MAKPGEFASEKHIDDPVMMMVMGVEFWKALEHYFPEQKKLIDKLPSLTEEIYRCIQGRWDMEDTIDHEVPCFSVTDDKGNRHLFWEYIGMTPWNLRELQRMGIIK